MMELVLFLRYALRSHEHEDSDGPSDQEFPIDAITKD
jgi:hypothetical protein